MLSQTSWVIIFHQLWVNLSSAHLRELIYDDSWVSSKFNKIINRVDWLRSFKTGEKIVAFHNSVNFEHKIFYEKREEIKIKFYIGEHMDQNCVQFFLTCVRRFEIDVASIWWALPLSVQLPSPNATLHLIDPALHCNISCCNH